MTTDHKTLYLIASAAPPVLRIEEFLALLSTDGWQVCVIATPTAASWIDLDALAQRTGCITRVHPRPSTQQDSLPRADAVVAAPITFNSINKWAAGISDTLALGILNELLSTDVPIIAAPCVKAALRKHPAYGESVTRLRHAGVVLLDPDTITRRGPDGLANFDWRQVNSALAQVTSQRLRDRS